MKNKSIEAGILTENSAGIGTVTRKMCGSAPIELAVINGSRCPDVVEIRWDQGPTGIDGRTDTDPKRQC